MMNLSTILGFLSLVGVLMVIGGVGLAVSNATQNRQARPGVMLAVVGVFIVVVFFLASAGLVEIGVTEVGVVFQGIGGDPANHNLWPDPLQPGVHIIVPVVNQVYTYSTEIHTYTMSRTQNEGAVSGDDSVAVRTSDGQQVYVDVTILYKVDPLKVNTVHLKFRDRYEEDYVRPTVRSLVRDVVSAYVVTDLLGGKRGEIENIINTTLTKGFADNGLALQSFLLRNITFSDEYIKAVESKQVAQQQAEQAIQEADRARTLAKGRADAAVTSAQGQADATVARAKGDAQAIQLRADADAEGLQVINEQLKGNPQLVQWRYIEKLAGDVGLILVPSNS